MLTCAWGILDIYFENERYYLGDEQNSTSYSLAQTTYLPNPSLNAKNYLTKVNKA